MKKKIHYTDEPMGKPIIVSDFLPSAEDLVFKQDRVKVTINLNRDSVDYFKKVAKKGGTQYQKVIRGVLDHYAAKAAR